MNEFGVLYTFGYVHRSGPERLRGEVFGGTMSYSGALVTPTKVNPFTSSDSIIGVRGEYEYIWNPAAPPWPSLFLGVGTRFWIRDIRDGTDALGHIVTMGPETWWTFYPYIGLEKAWALTNTGLEVFTSGRLGCTAFTYTYMPDTD